MKSEDFEVIGIFMSMFDEETEASNNIHLLSMLLNFFKLVTSSGLT